MVSFLISVALITVLCLIFKRTYNEYRNSQQKDFLLIIKEISKELYLVWIIAFILIVILLKMIF